MKNRIKMTAEEQCAECARKGNVCPIFGLLISQINRGLRRKCYKIVSKSARAEAK